MTEVEILQAAFVGDLLSRLQRLEDGPAEPEIAGTGYAFLRCSDDVLAEIKRRDLKEQRQAKRDRFGWARRD